MNKLIEMLLNYLDISKFLVILTIILIVSVSYLLLSSDTSIISDESATSPKKISSDPSEENKKKFKEIEERINHLMNMATTSIYRNSNLPKEFNNNDNLDKFIEENEISKELIKTINEENCLICLEKYSIGDKICYLPCLHFFHSFCIKKWIQIKKRCPLCNTYIKIES